MLISTFGFGFRTFGFSGFLVFTKSIVTFSPLFSINVLIEVPEKGEAYVLYVSY